MSDPREREEAIFNEALALPTMDRPRFLAEACGADSALRERIEGLLGASDSAGDFMDVPPVAASGQPAPAPGSSPRPSETPGSFIGRYKLLQKIGEGGCGVVWMAEQTDPVRRRVAVKIIKLGMDTREVVARFEAERQALALMDHPNIARVLDAGASDTGRPFFVMELVRGIPITNYCDENKLTPADRLELFIKVCHAVQHAHHKGVIHRDLKPSNILVTLHDSEVVPKVIDFGIAKATQGRLTDQTLFTAFEQFIGTPAYMSPEQAEMSSLDIDTRSDIYSLGVLLYELLAGRPPFDPQSLVQAGLDEVRRIIREVEPPKPSTNLSTLNDADRRTIARLRGTDPAELSLLLRGDLDWIVMKAMEKNRARRYETPTALAADIAHYLQHEPVTARPPSRVYRLGKMFRRHRVIFAALAAIAIVLVASSIVSGLSAIRAWRAERAADVERLKALRERARAEDLFGFMLGDLRASLAKVGRLDVLEAVGDKAMAYFASLKPGDLDDATLMRHVKALTQIGEIRMAQARYTDATAAFIEAAQRATTLAARHPQDGAILFERGQAEYWNGLVHWKRGELALAAEWFTRYRDTCVALVQLDPASAKWRQELAYGHQGLAVLNNERGELAAARTGFAEELATLEKLRATNAADPDLRFGIADAHSWLGGIAERMGDFPEALNQYVAQTKLLQELAQEAPDTARWRFKLGDAFLFQASILLVTGQLATAESRLNEAHRLLDELVTQDPANRRWEAVALYARLLHAQLLWRKGDATPMRSSGETRTRLENLVTTEPSDRGFALKLALAWRLEAQSRAREGRPDALTAAGRAVELGSNLIHDGRLTDAEAGEVATALVVSAEIAARTGDTEAAGHSWRRAQEILTPPRPGSRDWRLLDPAARASAGLNQPAEAQAAIAALNLLGYVPLVPWPDGVQPGPAKSSATPQQPK